MLSSSHSRLVNRHLLGPLTTAVARAGLAVVLLSGGLAAQNVTLDRGTFLLSRNGEAIGTETFTIRRTGSGDAARLIATAEVEAELDSGNLTVAPAMEVSASQMEVRAYQVKVSGADQTDIYMTLTGGRFQAKVVTGQGEEVREFRADPSSVLLDDGIAHHYYFLGERVRNGTTALSAVIPRAGRQLRIQATDLGRERIQIAGQTIHARHIQVEAGEAVRDVWMDEEGRVLRVIDRGSGLRAERRDLPG